MEFLIDWLTTTNLRNVNDDEKALSQGKDFQVQRSCWQHSAITTTRVRIKISFKMATGFIMLVISSTVTEDDRSSDKKSVGAWRTVCSPNQLRHGNRGPSIEDTTRMRNVVGEGEAKDAMSSDNDKRRTLIGILGTGVAKWTVIWTSGSKSWLWKVNRR